MAISFFQGQKKIIDSIENLISSSSLHHAILIFGHEWSGKKTLSKAIAYRIINGRLPEKREYLDQDILFAKPDIIKISTTDGKKIITVDSVRIIKNFLSLTASGHSKVVVMHDIHNMNVNAANALLKSLEEPTKKSYFIMTAKNLGSLPPTIVSRCQLYGISNPSKEDVKIFISTLPEERRADILNNIEKFSNINILIEIENRLDDPSIYELIYQFYLSKNLAIIGEIENFLEKKQDCYDIVEKIILNIIAKLGCDFAEKNMFFDSYKYSCMYIYASSAFMQSERLNLNKKLSIVNVLLATIK